MAKAIKSSKRKLPERAEDFVRLLERHARQIYGYILTLVPNWADAEDIFQETGAILWQKFDEFAPGTNFRAWACQVAYYRAIFFHRRQKRTAVLFGEKLLRRISVETLSREALIEERSETLADCVQKLPDEDRALIERCYAPGVTIKQAAEEMGRPLDATYKALRRIHHQLFECVNRTLDER